MSTMGREADDHARQVREIRNEAEKAAEDYLAVWRGTDHSICIKKGTKVVSLSGGEAKRVARGIRSLTEGVR